MLGWLGSLDGFQALTTIGGDLALLDLPGVTSLAPLGALTSIGNNMRIEILTSLVDATTIGDVAIHAGYCAFSNNAMLPACQATSILDQLVASGSCPDGVVNTFNLGTCP